MFHSVSTVSLFMANSQQEANGDGEGASGEHHSGHDFDSVSNRALRAMLRHDPLVLTALEDWW